MKGTLFTSFPPDMPGELFDTIAAGDGVRIERIVSRGHASDEDFWYDQETHEFVLLVQGSAALRFENAAEPIVLLPGDYLIIEPHARHRVEWTDSGTETIWLAVHY